MYLFIYTIIIPSVLTNSVSDVLIYTTIASCVLDLRNNPGMHRFIVAAIMNIIYVIKSDFEYNLIIVVLNSHLIL